jgi:hypothetical protein
MASTIENLPFDSREQADSPLPSPASWFFEGVSIALPSHPDAGYGDRGARRRAVNPRPAPETVLGLTATAKGRARDPPPCPHFGGDQQGRPIMKLLLDSQHRQLLENGRINAERQNAGQDPIDFKPVVKLFTPDAGATWLLTELDPGDPDIAFGLCDLGVGFPELGSVRLSEIAEVRGRLGLPVERDRHFVADKTISAYADEAARLERIKA